MKKIILITAILILGCNSQATKDREKMAELIKAEKDISNEFSKLQNVMYEEQEIYFPKSKPSDPDYFTNPKISDSMEIYDSMKRVIMKKHFNQLYDVEDSLNRIKTQIKELKLLMGK